MAADALRKSIVGPLISPRCDHFRSMRTLHEALLKTVKDITGKDAPFIQWNGQARCGPPDGTLAISNS